jgi:hypothetical protein
MQFLLLKVWNIVLLSWSSVSDSYSDIKWKIDTLSWLTLICCFRVHSNGACSIAEMKKIYSRLW